MEGLCLPPPPPPIDAPCTHCLRHGDPMHAQERLTADAADADDDRWSCGGGGREGEPFAAFSSS
jgi:hypothetical protein